MGPAIVTSVCIVASFGSEPNDQKAILRVYVHVKIVNFEEKFGVLSAKI